MRAKCLLSTLLLLAAVTLAACGDPEATPAAATPQPPPGRYALDVDDWLSRALEDVVGKRWSDKTNQASGADPHVRPDDALGHRGGRPPAPSRLEDMAEDERKAFAVEAAAYVRIEAERLEERLVLAADGSFEWTHTSRAADGGSMNLGLMRARVLQGTWALEEDALVLTTTRSGVPGGKTWAVNVRLEGRLLSDGAVRIEASRSGLRSQPSVFRRE